MLFRGSFCFCQTATPLTKRRFCLVRAPSPDERATLLSLSFARGFDGLVQLGDRLGSVAPLLGVSHDRLARRSNVAQTNRAVGFWFGGEGRNLDGLGDDDGIGPRVRQGNADF